MNCVSSLSHLNVIHMDESIIKGGSDEIKGDVKWVLKQTKHTAVLFHCITANLVCYGQINSTKCIYLSVSNRILRHGWMTQRSMALWWCRLELGSSTFPRTLLTNWQEPSPGYPSVSSGGKVSVFSLPLCMYCTHHHRCEYGFSSELQVTEHRTPPQSAIL